METTEFVDTKKELDFKGMILSQIDLLKKRHEVVKADMIKHLEAIQLLDAQYQELEKEIYEIETEYVELMKNLTQY